MKIIFTGREVETTVAEFVPSVPVHRLTRNLQLDLAYQDYSADTPPLALFRIKLRMQKYVPNSSKGLLFMQVDQQVPKLTVQLQAGTFIKESPGKPSRLLFCGQVPEWVLFP